MEPIIQTINTIYRGNTTTIMNFTIFNLLPYKITHYYRYNGSSTTPPCWENVDWYVAIKPIVGISERQATQLQLIQDIYGEKVSSL